MNKTTIQIDRLLKERINEIGKKYFRTTPNQTIELIINYCERNELDFNYEIKNGLYNSLKKFDSEIIDFHNSLNKNDERIIKILRRFELDYLTKISLLINNLGQENEIKKHKEENFKLNDLVNKIQQNVSKVTGKITYSVDINAEEFKKLKENVH